LDSRRSLTIDGQRTIFICQTREINKIGAAICDTVGSELVFNL
jgi:hypothetical protein